MTAAYNNVEAHYMHMLIVNSTLNIEYKLLELFHQVLH